MVPNSDGSPPCFLQSPAIADHRPNACSHTSDKTNKQSCSSLNRNDIHRRCIVADVCLRCDGSCGNYHAQRVMPRCYCFWIPSCGGFRSFSSRALLLLLAVWAFTVFFSCVEPPVLVCAESRSGATDRADPEPQILVMHAAVPPLPPDRGWLDSRTNALTDFGPFLRSFGHGCFRKLLLVVVEKLGEPVVAAVALVAAAAAVPAAPSR